VRFPVLWLTENLDRAARPEGKRGGVGVKAGRGPRDSEQPQLGFSSREQTARKVDVERHVEITIVDVGSCDGRKAADRPAGTDRAIGIHHRDGIDKPIVAVAVASQAVALNLHCVLSGANPPHEPVM
jgi:hypothetical protein